MSLVYIGVLQPALDSSEAADATAELVPQLIPTSCAPSSTTVGTAAGKSQVGSMFLGAASSTVATSGSNLAATSQPIAINSERRSTLSLNTAQHRLGKSKHKRHHLLNYYACTLIGCGFKGPSVRDHRRTRPQCTSHPCTLTYEKGTSATAAVDAFLSRCTQKQRELGLPPDYEKPVALPGEDGLVDPDILYLTVPIGLRAGDCFTVPTGYGLKSKVVVPDDKSEGDVIKIDARSGTK